MSWFDSFFSGLSDLVGGSNPSVADAAMGGTTDLGQLAATTPSFADNASSWVGDAASSAGNGLDWDSGLGGGISGANPASFGGGATPYFDPNSVGSPAPGGATLGSVTPNEGSSVAGSVGGGDPMTGAGGGDNADPEAVARQGTMNPSESSGQSVHGTKLATPPPTAWESLKQAPGKWWQNAAAEYNRAPISNTIKIGSAMAPVAGSLIAAGMAPSVPKYQPTPRVAAKPLPGTTGTSAADIPAGSPMSPLMNKPGSGGFKVGRNQGLATGGIVTGLAEGGKVGTDTRTQAQREQDERDYQEAMGRKPAAKPSKPLSSSDQQLQDAEAGKQVRPGGYFRKGYADGGQVTGEQAVEDLIQRHMRQFLPMFQSPLSMPYTQDDPESAHEMPTINLIPVNQGSRMPVVDPNELMNRSRIRGRGGPA